MSFTPGQCRAARALIGWSQDQLARASKVAKATIANFEAENRDPYPRTLDDIRAALEVAGVEFTNGGQPGVRIQKEYKQGDYVRVSQVGTPKISAGRNHAGKVMTTIEVIPADKRK
jgi:transcriptional regulator with XRE-family HTH domain